MLSLLLPLLGVVLLLGLFSRSAMAQEIAPVAAPGSPFLLHQPDHFLGVDLLAFSQWDDGGNPLVDEGFRYEAFSLDARTRLNDRVYLRGTAVVAYLQNNPLMALPSTIVGSNVTSASTNFVTLDASGAADLISPDGKWIVSPGFFYHHQKDFLVGGLDFDIRRFLAGGNTVVRGTLHTRYAGISQVNWDSSSPDGNDRITTNAILGLTQIISPKLVANASFQYTYQTGLLSSTLQFVGLYDAAGQPVQLVDEVLPSTRNRYQANLRGRYSPWVGSSFGLDLSGYEDDWGVASVAIEPGWETPVGIARLRVWYRVLDQRGTRYFTPMPLTVLPYMTQNSNLGTFVSQSPGMVLLVPVGDNRGPQWMLRASLLGFYRTDRIFGVGGSAGVSVEW